MTEQVQLVSLEKAWSGQARDSSIRARRSFGKGKPDEAAATLGYTSHRKEIVSPSLGRRHFAKKKEEMEAEGWKETMAHPSYDMVENGVKGRTDIYERNGVVALIRTFADKSAPSQSVPKSSITFMRAPSDYTPEEQAQRKKEAYDLAAKEEERKRKVAEVYAKKYAPHRGPKLSF